MTNSIGESQMEIAANDPHGLTLLDFARWHFEPTGDYGSDCATGRSLARCFLAWKGDGSFPPTLGRAMASIANLSRPQSGIEAGFFAVIAATLQSVSLPETRPSLIVINGGRS